MMNVINGGAHADNSIDLQEFMVVPCGRRAFAEGLRIGVEVYHGLKKAASRSAASRPSWATRAGSRRTSTRSEQAIDLILEAAERAGTRPGWRSPSIRPRARSSSTASIASRGARSRARSCRGFWADIVDRYPIVSIEDGAAEDDWDSWRALTELLGDRVQLVGDDIFVTNVERLREGVERGVANSILIKVNQIGTLTETIEAVRLAHEHGYTAVMSHRSGETEDATIADLAVALGTGQIKTGAPARSDRVAKYNQLLRIEEELGERATYPGWAAFPRVR